MKRALTFLLVVVAGLVLAQTAHASVAQHAVIARVNVVRAHYGLAPVHVARPLHLAAQRHTLDMVGRGYFAHTSPVGSTVGDRIVRSGFVAGYSWTAGETLVWHTGLVTAHEAVYSWMHSPEHRAILLTPRYRWIGAARHCGHFLGRTSACVWTADFVSR
jgi:uncharacterized protein YkwD